MRHQPIEHHAPASVLVEAEIQEVAQESPGLRDPEADGAADRRVQPRDQRIGGAGIAPQEGDDIATLAMLVNLPAVPVAAHWRVAPMSKTDSGRVPGPSDWYLDATITFSADAAAKITGVEAFYKSPLLTGQLMRIDDTHLHLILNTQ